MSYQEGQTATNPKTGQKVVFKGGQWVNAGGGGAILKPVKQTAGEFKHAMGNKGAMADLAGAERAINEVEGLYNKNFKGVGPGSLLEYLPTPARKEFDAASRMLGPIVKPLIRGPGEGPWTDGDQRALERLLPDGGAQDSDTEQRIKSLRGLLGDRKLKHGGAKESGFQVKRIK